MLLSDQMVSVPTTSKDCEFAGFLTNHVWLQARAIMSVPKKGMMISKAWDFATSRKHQQYDAMVHSCNYNIIYIYLNIYIYRSYIYIKLIHQKNGTTTFFKLNIIENKIKTLDSPALWSWCPARRKKNVPSSEPPERSAVPKVVRFEWSPELGGGYWKLPSYTQRRNPTATASSTDQKVKKWHPVIDDVTCYPLKMVIP